MRPEAAALTLALALAPATLAGCSSASSAPGGPPAKGCLLVSDGFGPAGAVAIQVQTVVTGLVVPWGIAFLPGGDWLVTERPGRVRLVEKGTLVPDPVATLPVHAADEGGLLGIAVSPQFATDRFFYLYATFSEGGRHNRVLRYKLAADNRSAALDKVLVDRIPGAAYHDGGRLRFGPDGMLYIGTGDARDPDRAQSLTDLGGKILRVQPDGLVPPDNPFPGNPVFLTGIRNTQGFDWLDEKTLLVTDHGPSGELGRRGHDEVSLAAAGQNLGWPTIYGCQEKAGMVSPLLVFQSAAPPGGAAIYKGDKIPEWKGNLLIGTLRSEHLHRVAVDKASRQLTLHDVYLRGGPPAGHGRLRDVVMGPDGDLYVTTSNCDGRGDCPADKDRVLRITR